MSLSLSFCLIFRARRLAACTAGGIGASPSSTHFAAISTSSMGIEISFSLLAGVRSSPSVVITSDLQAMPPMLIRTAVSGSPGG